jgi:hypothetical protein
MPRTTKLQCLLWLATAAASAHWLAAQDLAPRAYVITPLHSNAVTLSYAYFNGGINISGNLPVSGSGAYHIPVFSYFHSLNFFGRSANVIASLPYGVGNFEAQAFGQQKSDYRSGLLDLSTRISVNLIGAPAMQAPQFAKWKQKNLLGVSLRVVAPTGQYDPTKFINWSIHRWAFKPELGYSRRMGKWVIDGYGGAWFYTANNQAFHMPLPAVQTEEPIGSLEGHLSHDFGPFTWVSLDGNFWWGGITTLDGVRNPNTKQTSSRIGGTAAFRVSKHQSIKASYSKGAYIRFGNDYHNVSFAWQYNWLGRF